MIGTEQIFNDARVRRLEEALDELAQQELDWALPQLQSLALRNCILDSSKLTKIKPIGLHHLTLSAKTFEQKDIWGSLVCPPSPIRKKLEQSGLRSLFTSELVARTAV
ncbi:MAG: STAS domain-containing protein [Nitrospirales bacterium]